MSKFNKGDIVMVTGNFSAHRFPIGEYIRITQVFNDAPEDEYSAESLDGKRTWFVTNNDVVATAQPEDILRYGTFKFDDSHWLDKNSVRIRIVELDGETYYIAMIDGKVVRVCLI